MKKLDVRHVKIFFTTIVYLQYSVVLPIVVKTKINNRTDLLFKGGR
jgi:hypothetical protein